MQDSSTRQYLIQLVKSAVSDSAPDNPPRDIDWEDLFDYARIHRIIHLVYWGLNKLPFSVVSKIPQWNTYIMAFKMQVVDDANRTNETSLIHSVLAANEIPHMFLKGSVTRYMYPDTSLRIMRDIDVLYGGVSDKQLIKLMEDSGYSFTDSSYKEIVMSKPDINIKVEFQKQLIDSGYEDWNNYLNKVWKKSKESSDCSYIMNHQMFLLYHIIHMAKHFINGGIGINHIIDLWLIKNNYTDINRKKLYRRLKKLGLFDFYKYFSLLAYKWFENRELSKEANGTVNILENYIFASGAFGNTKQQAVNEMVLHGATKSTIRSKVFPGKHKLANYYGNAVIKYPLLRPWFWIRLNFERVFINRGSVSRGINTVSAISTRQINATKDLFERLGL